MVDQCVWERMFLIEENVNFFYGVYGFQISVCVKGYFKLEINNEGIFFVKVASCVFFSFGCLISG